MKHKKILLVIFIATLTVIWGHSMMPLAVSSEESLAITKLIQPVLHYKGDILALDHIIRKLAHFTEYSILGIELCLLLKGRSYRFPKTIAAGAMIAAIDETIQIFSGRGAMITDVLLDTSAVLFVSILIFIIGRKHGAAPTQ